MLVYLIKFDNDKGYVGVTSDLTRRLREHQTTASAVGAAMRKHTWTVQELFHGDRASCYEAEVRLVAELGTLAPGGYNLTTGGEGGFDMPPELVKKRGAAISRAFTPEKRAEHSAKLKASHRAEGMQEAQAARARQSWSRPEFRAAVAAGASKKASQHWADPAFRERHRQSMERYRQNLKQGQTA